MCLTVQRAPLCCNMDSVSFSRHNHQGLKLGVLDCLMCISGSAFMVLGLAFTVLGVLITAVLGYMTGLRFRTVSSSIHSVARDFDVAESRVSGSFWKLSETRLLSHSGLLAVFLTGTTKRFLEWYLDLLNIAYAVMLSVRLYLVW